MQILCLFNQNQTPVLTRPTANPHNSFSTPKFWSPGVKAEASIDSYDCHHYGSEGYTDFTEIIKPPLAISHAADKNFFLSEFGGPSCGGKLAAECHPSHPSSGAPKGCKDSCAWFDTPDETQLGMVRGGIADY